MSEVLMVISTVVVATATAVYAWLTWSVIQEARISRAEQFRPVVHFLAERDYDGKDVDDILLKVINTGLRAAYGIRISLDSPIQFKMVDGSDYPISEISGLLKYPIPTLAAGESMAVRIQLVDERPVEADDRTLAVTNFIAAQTQVITGSIAYQDSSGTNYTERVSVDFRPMANMKQVIRMTRDRKSLLPYDRNE